MCARRGRSFRAKELARKADVMFAVASPDAWSLRPLCFSVSRCSLLRFWRGYDLKDEVEGGEQVDEFVECEFVDVGSE